jgi:hypothetical protein
MRKEIVTEEVKCDMCNKDELDPKHTTMLRLHKSGGDTDGTCYDLCQECYEKVKPALDFITVQASLIVRHVWVKL